MERRIVYNETLLHSRQKQGFRSYQAQRIACPPIPQASPLQGFSVRGSTVEMHDANWQTFCSRFASPDPAQACDGEIPVALSQATGTRLQPGMLQQHYEPTLQTLLAWFCWWMEVVIAHAARPPFFLPDE